MRSRNQLQPIHGKRSQQHKDLIDQLITHVKTVPQQAAIVTTEETVTYQQLFDEVQHWKAVFAPFKQQRVLLYLDRTPRLVAVLLALQWLEVTYIPLDLEFPLSRINTILQDSQAQAFIYDTPYQSEYTTLACTQINLNEPQTIHKKVVSYLPRSSAIVYIIYTSGSTGTPKGVMISRRALNNFLFSMSKSFLLGSEEMLLAITTIAFDIAVLEIFLPIWHGKTIFLSNQAEHKDPFSIVKILEEYPITLLQATPSMWRMLEGIGWEGKKDLTILCGGEPLTQNLAQSLLSKVSSLWNMYGPTEATVWCAFKQIRHYEPISIGRPIDNTDMCVLDKNKHLLPPYVKGELYIGGVGLAEGYVNQKQTKDAFSKTTLPILKRRLYRVGDIACVTHEGEFIIFGRTDNQVKLHGFRIELEEIEACILAHQGIKECAVTIHQEQLIGYLCLEDSDSFSEKKLLHALHQSLPEYMVPKRFILLDGLPLTNNGKINRKALPIPSLSTNADATHGKPTELALINIWCDELKLAQVSTNNNFFELGGHSLAAARITARIHEQLGKKITLRDFYETQTIEKLAQVIDTLENTPQHDIQYKRNKYQSSWYLLNDFQFVLWIANLFAPQINEMHIAGRRRIQGPLQKNALDMALKLVFQKHEVFSHAIKSFYPLQKKQSASPPQWICTSLIDKDEETYEQYLARAFDQLNQAWISKRNPPLLIAKLFYLPNEMIEFHISMPHMIADECSLAIFFQDLSNAYQFFTHHVLLDAKETVDPFKSYTVYANRELKNNIETDTLFWQKYLVDAGLFCVPPQYVISNMEKQKISYSTYIQIPDTLFRKLQHFCIQQQVTMSDTLCAAIHLALMRCSETSQSAEKLFINVVKSTRDNLAYDHAVGCFLRIQPIKVACNEHSLVSIARQIQHSAWETAAHQFAPSMVKLASVKNLPIKKHSLKNFLITKVLLFLSKFSQKIPAQLFDACARLASFEHKNQFLVNINIRRDFLAPAQQTTLCGQPSLKIPFFSSEVSTVDNVLDASFIRDNQDIPYLVISANLEPHFREEIGQTFLEIVQQE